MRVKLYYYKSISDLEDRYVIDRNDVTEFPDLVFSQQCFAAPWKVQNMLIIAIAIQRH